MQLEPPRFIWVISSSNVQSVIARIKLWVQVTNLNPPEDCLYKAKWGMKEHVNLLKEQGLPIPPKNQNPKIIIQNEDVLITA